MIADDDLTDEERALLGEPARRKRSRPKPAPAKAMAAGYIRPSRGGIRTRRIRIPAFDAMAAIRGEMSKIYKTARLSVGDDIDSMTAKTLIDCLRAIASVKSIEIADELGLLEQMAEERLGKKGRR